MATSANMQRSRTADAFRYMLTVLTVLSTHYNNPYTLICNIALTLTLTLYAVLTSIGIIFFHTSGSILPAMIHIPFPSTHRKVVNITAYCKTAFSCGCTTIVCVSRN